MIKNIDEVFRSIGKLGQTNLRQEETIEKLRRELDAVMKREVKVLDERCSKKEERDREMIQREDEMRKEQYLEYEKLSEDSKIIREMLEDELQKKVSEVKELQTSKSKAEQEVQKKYYLLVKKK